MSGRAPARGVCMARASAFGAAKPVGRLARAVDVPAPGAGAVGSAVSLAARDPDFFHRFGALGVAASVPFFTDRLPKIELARQRSVARLPHEFGVALEATRSGTPPTEIPRHGCVVDFLTKEKILDRLRQTADRFRTANVGLLTVSTPQGGSGDLALPFLTTRGA